MPDSNPFLTTVPVRWSDFDSYGHINNLSYLEYAQEARVAFGRANVERGAVEPATVVRHIEIDYLRALLPDTREVLVESEIVALGSTSYTMRQTIKDGHNHIAAVVKSVMVLYDLAESRSIALTPQIRNVLGRYAAPELTTGDDVDGEGSGDGSGDRG